MKNIILLFLFLIPVFLFAQYPTTGNKQRLGYQTTGDGLIWRGVAADTVNKPNNRNYPYFQLDTVNAVLYRFIQTKQQWQPVTGGTDIDSLIYATRYWVSTNFFPLEGGTLTGTGGAGFVGFPSQVVAPGTPASGLNVYAQGSSFNWKGTDGFERLFASTLTGGRTYTLPDVSGTFALGTGTTDRSARWSATNTLAAGNFTDNGTKVQALLPFQLQQWTTAGRPTGVTGYEGYNTTGNGKEWYQGSRWAYALESTFARGTATYVPFFDANGQVTESQRVVYNGTQFVVKGTTNYASTNTKSFRVLSNDGVEMFYVNDNGFCGNNSFSAGNNGFTMGGGSGFPAFNVSGNGGTKELFQHETSTSISIADRSYTNIVVFDATNVFSASKAMRVYGRVSIGKVTPDYDFDITSTDAYGLPRGTVAQRPTIASNTTPLRFNTDSTALEYGESVGTWRQLATRAYARSLVSGLPTTNIYIANGALTGNRTITSGNYNVDWDNITGHTISSGGITPGSTVLSDTYYAQTQYYNLAKTRYLKRYETVDTRPATASASPNFTEIIEWDFGGGAGFEWLESTQFDTTNGVFTLKTGPRYNPGIHISNSLRPSSGSAYLSSPRWSFLGTNSTENETANSYHTLWGASPTDMLMGLKDGGKFLIASDSTMIFDPTIDVPQFNKMGVGTKEAADLSKTQSNYIAGFATDGTVLDLERKRDTTIFVTADTDYDLSAAVTTAQISRRYNRVIIHMTLTSGVGADKTTTLHAPDANLMQCEILIRGTDNTGSYANNINFGTNNAISSDGTDVSGYTLAQGQGLHVRVVYNGSAYKYIYY